MNDLTIAPEHKGLLVLTSGFGGAAGGPDAPALTDEHSALAQGVDQAAAD